MIELSSSQRIDTPHYRVDIDEYVPISFSSHEGLIGPKSLRFGNLITSLIEFYLDRDTSAILGFTVVAYDRTHDPNILRAEHQRLGRPMLSIDEGLEWLGPDHALRIDLRTDFSVGVGTDFVEVDLGNIGEADDVIVCGPAEYYFFNKKLAGVRVTGLTDEQIRTALSQKAAS